MRGLANWNTGFPNCTGTVTKSAATIAEVLRPSGYSTFAVGKWHLTPMEQTSPAGPFDQWPLARGFDRYYGFLDGETDQWRPDLTCDNHPIKPPKTPEEGYHLSEDLVDQAIGMVHSQKASVPEKPFFLYLAFGATHAPHQAPKEYLDKYRGKFDAGWDVVRKEWYERQKQLGIIPPDTELAPRNPGVKAWIELTADEQTLALRLQEAFAGFLEHTDAQIGRLIDYLDADRRTRQHAVPPDVRQRRQPGRRPARHGGLFALLQRPARNARREPRAHRRDRHAGRRSTTIRGAGRRSATRRASATSRTPTAAASAIR